MNRVNLVYLTLFAIATAACGKPEITNLSTDDCPVAQGLGPSMALTLITQLCGKELKTTEKRHIGPERFYRDGRWTAAFMGASITEVSGRWSVEQFRLEHPKICIEIFQVDKPDPDALKRYCRAVTVIDGGRRIIIEELGQEGSLYVGDLTLLED